MSSWKTSHNGINGWLPLGTRDGAQARVGPGDSPSHKPNQPPRTFESRTATPRHQASMNPSNFEAASIMLPPGQMPALAGSQPGSIPFFNPGGNNNNNSGNGFFFDLLSGQQNDSNEKHIHAPYFVSELLPAQQIRRRTSSVGDDLTNNSGSSSRSALHEKSPSISAAHLHRQSSVFASLSANRNDSDSHHHHHQWVAFAPISPDEVQLAVSTIVGSFPAHTLSRYSVERTLAARFNPPINNKHSEPTVLALYFFCGTRENALHVLHRHERSSLYKGVLSSSLGEVRCALSAPPSFSLACGVLHPFSQANSLRNNNNNVENSISLQLAEQVGRGNVSVCRKLEIRQQVPLRLKAQIWLKKYVRRLIYLVIAAFFLWLFFF